MRAARVVTWEKGLFAAGGASGSSKIEEVGKVNLNQEAAHRTRPMVTCMARLLAMSTLITMALTGLQAKAQMPQTTYHPTFIEMQEKATAAVNAYISNSQSASAETQKNVRDYYCSFKELPIPESSLVHSQYATSENCASKGLPLLRNLAEKGDVEAQFHLASYLNSTLASKWDKRRPPPDDSEAFKWSLRIATKTPPSPHSSGALSVDYKASAAGWLGKFYREGISVPRDFGAAFHWHQIAASLNNRRSIMEVADMLAKGEGTTKDIEASIRWLNKLGNDDEARLTIGAVYFFHDSDSRDRYEKATHIFELLHDHARLAHIRYAAAFYLGQAYYFGLGVKRDYRSAFDHLLEAAR